MSGVLDLFITLLSLGRSGWKTVWTERHAMFEYLRERVAALGEELGVALIPSGKNDISLALSLSCESREDEDTDFTSIGSQLFIKHGVSVCMCVCVCVCVWY